MLRWFEWLWQCNQYGHIQYSTKECKGFWNLRLSSAIFSPFLTSRNWRILKRFLVSVRGDCLRSQKELSWLWADYWTTKGMGLFSAFLRLEEDGMSSFCWFKPPACGFCWTHKWIGMAFMFFEFVRCTSDQWPQRIHSIPSMRFQEALLLVITLKILWLLCNV